MSVIKDKKILITGGAGFIGSNLCEYFSVENEVVCLDNFATGHQANLSKLIAKNKINFIEGDIRNFEICKNAVKGVDIVLHQAALGSVPRSIADPITTNSVNIDGFLNVLCASKDEGIKRFVYASSSSVYGDLIELPKQESKIGNPMSPYAVTKLVNEHYAKVFTNLYSIETIGLRYFNVFGKNQDPNGQYAAAIPKFIQNILDLKSPVIYGNGLQTRDFTYIKNVIHANEQAAITTNNNAFGNVFNIAFGEQTTVNELISVLINKLADIVPEKGIEIRKVKPIYENERKGDVKFSKASIELASEILNYSPQFSFEQGIAEAVEWYANHLK